MQEYQFKVLIIGGKEVRYREGFDMSAELQYIADQSWLNCYVMESPEFLKKKSNRPQPLIRSLKLNEISRLASWMLEKLEAILDTTRKPEIINNTFWYRELKRPLREVEESQLPPRFKMLSDILRAELGEDGESKVPILNIFGERVPLHAALGAYSLLRIDQGADKQMKNEPDFWKCFVEAGGSLAIGNMSKTGNYLIAHEKLESRRKGKQKKGKKSSETKPYFEPFKEFFLKHPSLSTNAKAVSFLTERSKLPTIEGKSLPSESTLKRWCKELSNQD